MAVSFTEVDVRLAIKSKRKISKWINHTIQEENKSLGNVVIALCSDRYILETNRSYLQHDYYTDIITFDYSSDELLSGDLLISIDTVKSNSEEYGVTFHDELMRIIIHGILHLCGYKDKTAKESKLMREKEEFYLKHLPEFLND